MEGGSPSCGESVSSTLLALSGSDMKVQSSNFMPCGSMCEISTSRNNGLISRAKETWGITFSSRQETQNAKFVNKTSRQNCICLGARRVSSSDTVRGGDCTSKGNSACQKATVTRVRNTSAPFSFLDTRAAIGSQMC